LRNGVPQELSGWLRAGRFGKRRFFRLRGIMLLKYKSPDEEPDWSCSMLNCEISVHAEKLKIHIPRWKLLFAAESQESFDTWVKALMYSANRVLSNHYELKEKIGEGMSGTVKKAICKDTGEEVAVKVVSKQELSPEKLTRLQNEAVIMIAVRSPQIISTIDIFDEEDKVYVVMEYLDAGTLDTVIEQKAPITEEQMRTVMTELIYGLAALHSLRIVHRDIKLENILCSFDSFPLGVKLVDFGFGAIIPEADDISNALQTMLGTWHYIAPEQVFRKPYGPCVDMWAAGVVMYRCLTGTFPFDADNPNKLMRMIRKGTIDYGPEWDQFSPNCKDFVGRLLEFDAEARIKAEEALAHPWVCGEEKSLSLIQEDPILDQLRAVQDMVQHAKLIFKTADLRISEWTSGNARERDSKCGSLDRDSRNGLVDSQFSSTSPSSLVSDREQVTRKTKPVKGGMLMMGIGKSFTPPHKIGLAGSPRQPELGSSFLSSADDISGFSPAEGARTASRRRGKLAVVRNFDVEDQFANDGDWV